MDATRWKQIDELVDAAMEIPDAERERFVSENSNGDDRLRREVLALLNAQKESDDFLQNSAMDLMAEVLARDKSAFADSALLGKEFGTYKIESLLGAGGMGEVYLAYDSKINRKVALKILPAEFIVDAERVKRFEREARAVSTLNHPYIVTVYDFGNIDGINYITTEYVEGKTVRELMDTHLTLKEILSIVIQTCEALSAAHEAKIIHRDIKPENIMVRPDGYVKILDFGLAKLSDAEIVSNLNFAQTVKGAVIGTPAYMSPEQIIDEKVDHRTDLWSVGVVLYEMLTGKNPFKSKNHQTTFKAILTIEPPLASSLNPAISANLDQILVKALEKDADISYQTASDLIADLRREKREVDSSPSYSLRSGKVISSRKSRAVWKRFLPISSGVTVLILAIAGIGYFIGKIPVSKSVEATEWVGAKHSQITDSPWVEGYPSLSPDGKFIIFASDTNYDRNIYRQRVGGKNPINLTMNSKESDTMPAFSPDGKYIAFRSERQPNGIYVMEETGENPRRVSDLGFHPAWSPDGAKIVVSDKAAAIHTVHTLPNSLLWIIDVKTGNKQLLETRGDAIMPSWSPNGYRIAYWFVAAGQSGEIATIPAEGGEPVVVAGNAASDWNPVWSPDGKHLYFASDRGGNMNFWRVAIDEKTGQALGEPESVPTPSKYCRHITLSRDGKTLAYVRYESQSNLQSISFDPKTGKSDGDVMWITRGDKEIGNPELSPNGEAYLGRQPTRMQEDLVIFDKDGANWRNLMTDSFRERLPRWSPDSQKIAFSTDRSGEFQVWTINPDGSDARQITFTKNTGANAPIFSPDGRHLAYTEINDKTQKIFILDLIKSWSEQTPQPLPTIPDGSFVSSRDWSDDGKKILYSYFEPDGDETGTGVFDFTTSTYEKMTETGSNPFWLNDNRRFIYTYQNAVYLCDTQTKKTTEIFKPSAYELQHANISPDNKTIYFRYLQIDANVWVIDASQPNQ